ncbi:MULTISPECIES: hypothetical protein [Salinibaculum]|uniref:hypothetical protein n=1 Tax=Salinibaculum TaxID=2732368 RepID=UPI0030CE81B8
MDEQPSLFLFIGMAVFMTIVAVYVGSNVPLGDSLHAQLLAYLSAFAIAQTMVTYVMIRQWLDYAESNWIELNNKETTSPTSDD